MCVCIDKQWGREKVVYWVTTWLQLYGVVTVIPSFHIIFLPSIWASQCLFQWLLRQLPLFFSSVSLPLWMSSFLVNKLVFGSWRFFKPCGLSYVNCLLYYLQISIHIPPVLLLFILHSTRSVPLSGNIPFFSLFFPLVTILQPYRIPFSAIY